MSRSPLFIIFLTVFIDLLGFGIVLPLLPRYGEHFHASKLTVGLLFAAFSGMQFVFAPLWGRLSDRIGRRPVLLVGLAGSAIAYFCFARITQLGNHGAIFGLSPLFWLFVSRIGAGIAGATIPTAQAYIADSTDAANRGKGMALIGVAFGLGFIFGPLIGSVFVPAEESAGPSSAPGYVAAVLSAGAFLWALAVLPESRRGTEPGHVGHWFHLHALPDALARPYLGGTLWAVLLTTMAFGQLETTLSTLTKELNLGLKHNFYVFAYIGLVLTLAQGLFVRRMIPRLGEFWMALLGVVLMTAGLLSLGYASREKSMMLVYCVLPISVIGFACTTPSLQALLSLCSGDDEQGGILGVGQSMSALGRILAPVIALPLQGWSLAVPYWVSAGLMAVSLGLILPLRGAVHHRRTALAAAPPAV